MKNVLFVSLLIGAMPVMAGDWPIFGEVPQGELDEISGFLDDYCRAEADSLAMRWAIPKSFAQLPGGEIVNQLPSHEEMAAEIFKVCREAAAYSALHYGAAVNRARRDD